MAAGGQTGNIQGTVIDTSTKAPIANVTVVASAPSGRAVAKTDAHGFFALNGLPVDTYTVSFALSGYETLTESGVTLQGDQTTNMGNVTISRRLQTIGRTAARSRASVFQPQQTTDEVTVTGNRALEALGNPQSISENQLALSVPGVTLTNMGRLTIRGGLSSEVGYQVDGIPVDEPFLNQNSTLGTFNGLNSLQIVAGAGDASQGNIGGGVVNEVIKRGTYPAGGTVGFTIGGPSYLHQGTIQYGWATPDNRFSDYASYVVNDNVPYYGYLGTNVTNIGDADGLSRIHNGDFLNNFVFKFGHQQNQSLQVLYEARDTDDFGDRSGLAGRVGYPYNLFTEAYDGLPQTSLNPGYWVQPPPYPGFTYTGGPYSPGISSLYAPINPTSPEEVGWNPFNLLKFEYDNNFNGSTSLQIRAFNEQSFNGLTDYYSYASNGIYQLTGGDRSGVIADLTKTFSPKHTVSIGGSFQDLHPIWDGIQPYVGLLELQGYAPGATSLADFAPGGYLSTQGLTNVNVPAFGINYNKTLYQEYGAYIREQYTPNAKLRIDAGFRVDGFHWKQGNNPYNTDPNDVGNPDDVPNGGTYAPGYPNLGNYLRNEVENPVVPEPRFNVTYEFDPNDSLRFGFARSVIFPTAQTLGTPMGLYGVNPALMNVPATGNTADPATWTCGTGYNARNLVPGDANVSPHGGGYYRCANYAQELYWAFDQNFDAPDVGNNYPETFNQTELTYQHQFSNGWGTRLTGYYKRGFDIPAFNIISQTIAAGVITSEVFGVTNVALNKTSGVEFGLTTPDRPVGWSGYLSATYNNVIDSVPPLIASEDTLPLVSKASIELGNTYRAGYVSPLSLNLGANYRTRTGWRINPIITFDNGYPTGAGNLLATQLPNGQVLNLPNTNLNPSEYSGFLGQTGPGNSPNFVDPVNPGTYQHPYIAATRGTPETSSAGGVLSRARMYANLDIEWTHGRNTIGFLVQNIFGNVYDEPMLNPFYQPVATGIAGPQTGTSVNAAPGSILYQYGAFRDIPTFMGGAGPYVEPLGNPTNYQLYYQFKI
ncbi:MAG TPA: TonB-dependent receptor [Candidatus Baltobacteraceae bacterium]|nr:TonB-dependent receptor [Candidatus Baltobacteraceae bacterium]